MCKSVTIGATFVAAVISPISVRWSMAQGVSISPAPGIHIGIGHHPVHHHHHHYYGGGGHYYGDGHYYGGGRRHNTYNGCRPGWTIQGGVCKPYRGH
jgi:hypothetical protein